MTGRGQSLKLGLKLELCHLPPDQRVVKVLSPPKSQHKLCGVSILFKSVTDAKFEPSEVTLQSSCPALQQIKRQSGYYVFQKRVYTDINNIICCKEDITFPFCFPSFSSSIYDFEIGLSTLLIFSNYDGLNFRCNLLSSSFTTVILYPVLSAIL